MHWIAHYDLFLFDFDGLLADTEGLHFLAYQEACRQRGLLLPFNKDQYAKLATFSARGLRDALTTHYPELASCWESFYREKKACYLEILEKQGAELMPGITPLLERLKELRKVSCVVTNSPKEHVGFIRSKQPILESITHWITREDYEKPKPDPECYQKACARYAKKGDRIIGFEDSPRGLTALTVMPLTAILVSDLLTPEEIRDLQKQKNFLHVRHVGELSTILPSGKGPGSGLPS